MRSRDWVCLTVILAWLGSAAVAPLVLPTATAVDLTRMFARPQWALWLGADDLGRAIAPRVISGAGVSCPVALLVVAISFSVGSVLGITCAWCGGRLDFIGMRVMDACLAFPGILLAIALAGIMGPGLGNVVIALCSIGWVGFARLARAQTLSVKHREHVLVAEAMGVRPDHILMRHVWPLVLAPLLVEASFAFASAIAAEAGMSFLGLGVQPPTPSWGSMLREAAQFLLIAPHLMLGPALAIVSLVFSVQILGERLRAHLQFENHETARP